MNKYLITYDLKDPNRDYSGLHNAIKSTTGLWWHYLESTWIVKSPTKTAQQINDELLPHINKPGSDRLLVIKIDTTNKQGWLPKDAWDWLNS